MNLIHDIDKLHVRELSLRSREKILSRLKSRLVTLIFLTVIFIIVIIVNFKSFGNTLSMIPVYVFAFSIALMIIFFIIDYFKLKAFDRLIC